MMGRKGDEAQITALHERINQINEGIEKYEEQQKQMESRWAERFQKNEDQLEAKTNKLQAQVTASATPAERIVKEALDSLNVESAIRERAQSQLAVAIETLRENIKSELRGQMQRADSMPALEEGPDKADVVMTLLEEGSPSPATPLPLTSFSLFQLTSKPGTF